MPKEKQWQSNQVRANEVRKTRLTKEHSGRVVKEKPESPFLLISFSLDFYFSKSRIRPLPLKNKGLSRQAQKQNSED